MARNEKVQYTLSLRDAFSGKMNDANDSVDRFNKDAKEGTKRSKGFSEGLKNIAAAGAAIAGSLGIGEVVKDLRMIGKSQTQIAAATDASGEKLEDLATTSRSLASTVDADSRQIIRAANAIQQNFGGEFEDALAMIEEGFNKGANANGNLLEQLKEYSPVLKSMGVDAQQFFGIVAETGQAGLFSDKGIDAIKEFQNSLGDLNEEGNDVKEALNSIGVDETKVIDLFDAGEGMKAIQAISQAITDLESQTEQQNIISRIFRGPGEDAGREFFELMANGTKDLKDLPSTLSPLDRAFREFDSTISRVRNSFSEMFGDAFISAVNVLKDFEDEIIAAGKALIIVGGAGGAIFAVVRAVQALNAALIANPIGAIIAAVAALTAGLIYLFQTNEGFRESVLSVWQSLKELLLPVIKELWTTIKEAFAPIIERVRNIFKELEPVLTVVGKVLGGVLFAAIKAVSWNLQLLAGYWEIQVAFIQDVIAGVKTLIEWFKGLNIIDTVVNWFDDLLTKIAELFGLGDKFLQFKEFLTGIFNEVGDAFSDIFSFENILTNLADGLSTVGNMIAGWLEDAGLKNTSDAFRSAVEGVSDFVRPEDERQSGRDAFLSGAASNRGQEDKERERDGAKEIVDSIRQQSQIIKRSNLSLSKMDSLSGGDLGEPITNMNTGAGESSSVSGTVRSDRNGGRRITVNINNLVETFNLTAANLEESAERTRDEIARALTAAITDSAIVTTN